MSATTIVSEIVIDEGVAGEFAEEKVAQSAGDTGHLMQIASFYNKEDTGYAKREKSAIGPLRDLHNWIKLMIIHEYVREGDSVLDLACGKGGDLNKFSRRRIGTYVGADLAGGSVRDAVNRYNGMRQRFPALFCVGDCFAGTLDTALPKDIQFDAVSCQFAFHYAFASEERVRAALQNITCRLKPGGVFVSTVTDSNVLMQKVRCLSSPQFGNKYCSIKFAEPVELKPFGMSFDFDLIESVGNVTEFLVHVPSLQRVAKDYDLELERHENFHSFFHNTERRYARQLMVSAECPEHFPSDQWDISYLYTVLVFRKTGRRDPPSRNVPRSIARGCPGNTFQEDSILRF